MEDEGYKKRKRGKKSNQQEGWLWFLNFKGPLLGQTFFAVLPSPLVDCPGMRKKSQFPSFTCLTLHKVDAFLKA